MFSLGLFYGTISSNESALAENMNANDSGLIGLSTVVRQSSNQVAAEIDGETAMMSIQQGNYYMLNEVGTRIWSLIDQPVELSKVVDTILDEFNVEREVCEKDTQNLVREMLDHGLVEIANEPTG